jgi:uncharacterized protein (DUF2252 family)
MSTKEQSQAAEAERRAAPAKVEHFTFDERVARGKAARGEVPRGTIGDWDPPPSRPDPIDVLEEQARTRVPELVPIRYGRMLVSPFAFYRGAAAVMAADLADGPRTGLHAQLCGDAHLSNFGVFAAPDRRLVFSVNDFDETLPGPFEWDVKRLVASFAIAGRELGFAENARRRINAAVGRSYRESIRRLAAMANMDQWYARIDVEADLRGLGSEVPVKERKRLARDVARARTKDSLKAFSKLTHIVDGEPRIVGDPPLIVPLDDLASPDEQSHEVLGDLIRMYRRTLSRDRRHLLERYRFVDAARKVVGVGSVGTRAWIVLMLGGNNDDPLFLQAKEAEPSALEPYLGKSRFANHGQRVVEGQRLMQAASDVLLGWIHVVGLDGLERDFYVRQLWDAKGSARIETMGPISFALYAEVCAWALAIAHARSGDAAAIAAYLGGSDTFDRALASFAEAYADQNERDYEGLREAVATGRVTAETGL